MNYDYFCYWRKEKDLWFK